MSTQLFIDKTFKNDILNGNISTFFTKSKWETENVCVKIKLTICLTFFYENQKKLKSK